MLKEEREIENNGKNLNFARYHQYRPDNAPAFKETKGACIKWLKIGIRH